MKIIIDELKIMKEEALRKATIDGDMDQEPYEAGKIEGDNQEIRLNDHITVTIHACDDCGEVMSADIDGHFGEIKHGKEIDKLISELKISQVEKNKPDDTEYKKKQFAILVLEQLKKRIP